MACSKDKTILLLSFKESIDIHIRENRNSNEHHRISFNEAEERMLRSELKKIQMNWRHGRCDFRQTQGLMQHAREFVLKLGWTSDKYGDKCFSIHSYTTGKMQEFDTFPPKTHK